MRKLTTQEFIDRSRAVHGDKYGYAFSVYLHSHTKIHIYCRDHDMFEQSADKHLRGRGCPSCSKINKAKSQTSTTKKFIEKARKVHGYNTYDYSLTDYVGATHKVKITCSEHGVFKQQPNNHLSGQGCPGCVNYGFDRTKEGFLYILRSDCGQYMKIGITNKPVQRYAQLSRATPFSFKRIELIEGPGDQIADLEKELLADYQPVCFTETFDGSTEWRLWDNSVLTQFQK